MQYILYLIKIRRCCIVEYGFILSKIVIQINMTSPISRDSILSSRVSSLSYHNWSTSLLFAAEPGSIVTLDHTRLAWGWRVVELSLKQHHVPLSGICEPVPYTLDQAGSIKYSSLRRSHPNPTSDSCLHETCISYKEVEYIVDVSKMQGRCFIVSFQDWQWGFWADLAMFCDYCSTDQT